jgi:hypothetical protein
VSSFALSRSEIFSGPKGVYGKVENSAHDILTNIIRLVREIFLSR